VAEPQAPLAVSDSVTRIDPDDPDNATVSDAELDDITELQHPETLLYVLPTSGSTGTPKLVGIPRGSFTATLHWYISSCALNPQDVVLVVSSPVFDLTQKNLLAPLLVGGRIVFSPVAAFDPAAAMQQMRREGVTLVNCTPSTLYALLDAGEITPSLKHMVLGGEPINGAMLKPLHAQGVTVINSYGPAECTDVVAWGLCKPADLNPPLGHAVPHARLVVRDAQQEPMPVGIAGELHIAGDSVGRGYVNDSRLTALCFRPDDSSESPGARRYSTGDQVVIDKNGQLRYLGRTDRQLKVRGIRVEPGEIERILECHNSVLRAKVILVTRDKGPAWLTAYVVTPAGVAPTASELRSYVAARLPESMTPVAFVNLPNFPLNRNAKVDIGALPPPRPEHLARRSTQPPRTATERLLAKIWSELLATEDIGFNDDFFELGGHSLLVMRLRAHIASKLSIEPTVATFFERSTLAGLADVCDTLLWASTSNTEAADIALHEERI